MNRNLRKNIFAVLRTIILTQLSFMAIAQTAAPPPANQPLPNADMRVASVLKKIGYKYEITKLGNFKLDFALPDKRGHWVYVSSRTEKFEGYETRKIWAYVYKSKDLLSADLANKLLMDNVPQKAGAFELSKTPEGDGYHVVYSVKIDADAGPKAFKAAVRLVLLTADEKEKELTKKDDF